MTQSKSVADIVVEFLTVNGLKDIFGIVGDAVFPFFDTLAKNDGLNYYSAAHEANAALMASYQAKLTGKAGVCVGTSGPGTANLVNGLADAYFDRAPVLVITGQVGTAKLGTGAKQYINQQQLLAAVTKSSELIVSPDAVLPIISKALAIAVNERTVAHVAIPVDLFTQPVTQTEIPRLAVKINNSWASGFAGQLEDVVTQLNSSNRPLVLIGTGRKALREELISLSEAAGAGIIVAQQAKGVIPDSHPQVLGGIGEGYRPKILEKADFILQIGTASFEKKFLPSKIQNVQVIETLAEADFTSTNRVVSGEIRQLLKLISSRIRKKPDPVWLKEIKQEKEQLVEMIKAREKNPGDAVDPAFLMATLSKVVAKDAVIVNDVGGFIHWFDTYFRAEEQEVLVSSHWRSMGGGLPGALSACIAEPQKQVVALVGDGGLMMSLGELATAVKYQLPVIVIVANDRQYNLEKTKMKGMGLKPYGYDLNVPDFKDVAEAFGVAGKRVTTPAELVQVLEECIALKKPVLVDVQLQAVELPFTV